MVMFNIEIRDSKIKRLIEEKNMLSNEYHALTER